VVIVRAGLGGGGLREPPRSPWGPADRRLSVRRTMARAELAGTSRQPGWHGGLHRPDAGLSRPPTAVHSTAGPRFLEASCAAASCRTVGMGHVRVTKASPFGLAEVAGPVRSGRPLLSALARRPHESFAQCRRRPQPVLPRRPPVSDGRELASRPAPARRPVSPSPGPRLRGGVAPALATTRGAITTGITICITSTGGRLEWPRSAEARWIR